LVAGIDPVDACRIVDTFRWDQIARLVPRVEAWLDVIISLGLLLDQQDADATRRVDRQLLGMGG
jgi:hypothetical protein